MPATLETIAPTAIDELAVVLRDTAPRTVRARGAGTKLGWGAAGDPVDVELDLRSLGGEIQHNPGDLVVSARAGTPLQQLQDHVAEHRQWLALDPPEQGATLGGVVAAGASGPRRHRYGTVRDLLIGVTVVLADGTLAKAGGKVVKNVAGYDLMKLYTGSLGTLGVVVEMTWRLHPQPPARRVVTFPSYDGDLVARLLRATLTPTAVEAVGERLVVVFESIEPSVVAQAETARKLGVGTRVGDGLPDGFGARPWRATDIGLQVAYPLGALDPVLTAVRRLGDVRLAGRLGVGVLEVAVPALDAAALARLRAEVAAYRGTVVLRQASPDLDVWGPVGDALPLMRRVKEQFDPQRRLSPGRFVGGI